MDIQKEKIIHNISFNFISNIVSLFVSILIVSILPKVLDIPSYGYYQLYVFYTGYIGLIVFGWTDGIYLRYGGKHYHELDKKMFFSQYIIMQMYLLVIILISLIGIKLINVDLDKKFVIIITFISGMFLVQKFFFDSILLATNQIIKSSWITLLERVALLLLVIILMILGVDDYRVFLISNLVAYMVSAIISAFLCRDILKSKMVGIHLAILESRKNISVGVKLAASQVMSMLIIGIIRLGIESNWGISTFGKISLSLSITSMFMIFIKAVGNVFFPLLRRASDNNLKLIYNRLRVLIMVLLTGILILYYPFKTIFINWLPDYEESFKYMGLMFPILIHESKVSLLVNVDCQVELTHFFN
jgi:O-antigen/teichoic acid export membrane protein